MTTITVDIHMGDNTHTQDHVILPISFKIMKAMVSMLPADIEDVLFIKPPTN